MNYIIKEDDIINTYSKAQQEQSRLYYEYKKIKQENPEFGYKKIAKLMNQPYHKTRWWHAGKHKPIPIQTVNWLKKRRLIPLKFNHKRIHLIAKIFGSSFGDGGIFGNLNAIFLSSSEKFALYEFKRDLNIIFGIDIELNSREIEGGEYGESWSYQNTNRKVIRFFKALGSPIGKKTKTIMKIPKWVSVDLKIEDYFYGALFGSEIGIPKMHVSGTSLNSLEFGITSKKNNDLNIIKYLKQIKKYFNRKKIKTNKIYINYSKEKEHYVYRIPISTKFSNIYNFKENIKLYYCDYKGKKLDKIFEEFKYLKEKRYFDLIDKGYTHDYTLDLLNLTSKDLYIIKYNFSI